MNEKIKAQIGRAKTQTIGVEIEMNNITRNKAAKIAAEFSEQTDTKTQPTGTDTSHGQHGTARAGSGSFKRT